MAKRGETRPWRMTYTWTGDAPASGTNTFTSLEQATDAARVQAERIGGVSGEQDCVAVVTHRAQPDVVRARFAGRDARLPDGTMLVDGVPAEAVTFTPDGGATITPPATMVEQVSADLDTARAAGRVLTGTSVKPFNDGAIVSVEVHPTDSGATHHRVYDVRCALGRAGWATRPSGTQVIVEGRAAAARQADVLARTDRQHTESDPRVVGTDRA